MPRPKKTDPEDQKPQANPEDAEAASVPEGGDPALSAQEIRDMRAENLKRVPQVKRMTYGGEFAKFYYKGVTAKKGETVAVPDNWEPADVYYLLRHGWKKA